VICETIDFRKEVLNLMNKKERPFMYHIMSFRCCSNLFSVLFILFCNLLHISISIDTVTSSKFIKDPETLISKDGNFTFGFFSPINSTNRYVGIWWKSRSTVLWVANRNQPLNDSIGIATVSENGNLVVLNGQKQVIWSSNVSNITSNTTVQFSEYGNLVLLESATRNMLRESIQQPSDALLPGMKLSIDKRTGDKLILTSWKNPSDPSVGSFSSSAVIRDNIAEVFIWNDTWPYWHSGPWNGGGFTGILTTTDAHIYGFQGGNDGEGNINVYSTIPTDEKFVTAYILNSKGKLESTSWDGERNEVQVTWTSRVSECDGYGICGVFASCSSLSSPICTCLKDFEPKKIQEWNRNNWTGGCVRRTPLQCERVNNKTTGTKEDGFMKLQMVKVPDFAEGAAVAPDICRSLCLQNCSCVVYSRDAGIGCMSWTRNLIDIQQLESGGLDLYVRVSHAEPGML